MEKAKTLAAGPEKRLEQWIADYSDGVWRLCFVYLRDAAQAEDAMQDTFIKAWQHMGRIGSEKEKAWLMRIAVNTCHDYHRSRWFRHVDMGRALEELPPGTMSVLPEDHALLMEVCALPEKLKQAVLLYYYQEMTLEETAASLHISRSTVHKRLERARQLLKAELTGRENDGE